MSITAEAKRTRKKFGNALGGEKTNADISARSYGLRFLVWRPRSLDSAILLFLVLDLR